MSYSIGLIESKGLIALIEAADVILKNSPVSILGIHKLENGLVTLAVKGNSDYVKAAIESGVEAGRRVGEIYAFSIVENPNKELLDIFSDLFPGNNVSRSTKENDIQLKVKSEEITKDENSKLFGSILKSDRPDSKREKSKPLQVTKITPIHKIKKAKDQKDIKPFEKNNESFESKIADDIKTSDENKIIPESTKTLSTIERLRLEALGLESKSNKSNNIRLSSNKKSNEPKGIKLSVEGKEIDFDLIDKMNVHKLRHYAREFTDFPIKGREISRANRTELVELFRTIKKI